jgi:ketohexokinase
MGTATVCNGGMKQTNQERTRVAQSAAAALDAIDPGSIPGALVGFDGFIDWIARVVDRRHDMSVDGYEPIRTIEAYAARCAAAAGKSTNIEVVDIEQRWGGNGPLLAGTMATLGTPTTYIGAVGSANDPRELDPLFAPLARACREVIPIGLPGRTDAFEFDDGKLMFNRTANVQRVGWDLVRDTVGVERLIELMANAPVLGLVNWSLMGDVEGVWHGLMDEVFPRLVDAFADVRSGSTRTKRMIFIDLSDPAKRSDHDIERVLTTIHAMQSHASVTLGLNLAEAQRLAAVTGVAIDEDSLECAASDLLSKVGIGCVVIHPREGAAAATDAGERASFGGPTAAKPTISTGAGDHFNGGFVFARSTGLGLAESLAAGCAASGWYVRHAAAPSRGDLVRFLNQLPLPEPTP